MHNSRQATASDYISVQSMSKVDISDKKCSYKTKVKLLESVMYPLKTGRN